MDRSHAIAEDVYQRSARNGNEGATEGLGMDRKHESHPLAGGLSALYGWSGREDLSLRPPAPEVSFAVLHLTLCVPG
jgi:hypothetical protein